MDHDCYSNLGIQLIRLCLISDHHHNLHLAFAAYMYSLFWNTKMLSAGLCNSLSILYIAINMFISIFKWNQLYNSQLDMCGTATCYRIISEANKWEVFPLNFLYYIQFHS